MADILQFPVPYWLIHDGYVDPGPIVLCERCLEEWDDDHVCEDR